MHRSNTPYTRPIAIYTVEVLMAMTESVVLDLCIQHWRSHGVTAAFWTGAVHGICANLLSSLGGVGSIMKSRRMH